MVRSVAKRRSAPPKPGASQAKRARIGVEMRGLRKAKNLTLMQLGAVTGLSVGYLSMVERERVIPSIKALLAISNALGVTVGWFFEADAVPAPERGLVVRRWRRRRLDYSSGIIDELLSPSLKGSLEMLMSRIPPGASSGEEPYSHTGEEAGLVVRGRLEFWVNGQELLLEAGDSFGFESSLPHRYRNPGPDEAEVVWVITPPSF